MLQQSTRAAASAPQVGFSDNPADRRAHERVPSARLRGARVRILTRGAVSLVDLSSGGALLEIPFQAQPEARFAVELHTPVERVEVPFQLLRCYVAELKGGVTYHAAGVFDKLLNVQAMTSRASGAAQRLIATLERMRRGTQTAASPSRSAAQFSEMLAGVIVSLRRGESLDLVALKVRAHLTQNYRSLSIVPSSPYRDALTSVECFGLTFNSTQVLSAHDRRYLKANAQLLSMMEDCRREMRAEEQDDEGDAVPSNQVIRSTAEWLEARSETSADADYANLAALLKAPPTFRWSGTSVFGRA